MLLLSLITISSMVILCHKDRDDKCKVNEEEERGCANL